MDSTCAGIKLANRPDEMIRAAIRYKEKPDLDPADIVTRGIDVQNGCGNKHITFREATQEEVEKCKNKRGRHFKYPFGLTYTTSKRADLYVLFPEDPMAMMKADEPVFPYVLIKKDEK